MKTLIEQLKGKFEEHREATAKWLTVLGVVAVSLLLAWLAVTTVRLLPAAYSALTSLSLWNTTTSEITLSAPSLVNAGEDTSLSWEGPTGTYAFSYDCAEGVSVELREDDGHSRIACDTEVPFIEETKSATIALLSTERRFADVRYEVRHTDGEETVGAEGLVTVVNPAIRARSSETLTEKEVEDETGDEMIVDTATEETVVEDGPATESVSTSALAPVADLALSVVSLDPVLREGMLSSLQLSVQNIGAVRSGIWYLDAVLPTTPSLYRSGPQESLAPGEGVLLTLTFEVDAANSARTLVSVTLGGGNDENSANNALIRSVLIY